uniref:Uncharacterized protein n=1 Tax=Amorphochlora amoebiformis TaxID=1561963 RepID=A0A7S0DFP9_9EUKA
MNASLFYYKGYSLRNKEVWPAISDWFNAMEERSTYLGIQSDFHTHVHDLPPQMGGCYSNHTKQAKINQKLVDSGPYHSLPDTNLTPAPKDAHLEAIARVVKHKDAIIKVNPVDESTVNTALLATLTLLAKGEMKKKVKLGKDSDVALRYIRDRINVPRDMSIFAARKLRGALEATAKTCGEREGPSISLTHRRDQNPIPFRKFESC